MTFRAPKSRAGQTDAAGSAVAFVIMFVGWICVYVTVCPADPRPIHHAALEVGR